jgi:hypothetical protein
MDPSGSRARRSNYKGVSKSSDGWHAVVFQRGTLVDLGFHDTEVCYLELIACAYIL